MVQIKIAKKNRRFIVVNSGLADGTSANNWAGLSETNVMKCHITGS